MSKSEDQSVPIGSDWNTSKSIVKKKQQDIRIANLPPAPPLPPSDEISPSNTGIVRIKFIGNKMKFGFAILFVVWAIQFFEELHHLEVIQAEGDPEKLEIDYYQCDSDSYSYDLEKCLDALQEDLEAYQSTRVTIVAVQIFAWALVATDLFAISSKLNKMQIVNYL